MDLEHIFNFCIVILYFRGIAGASEDFAYTRCSSQNGETCHEVNQDLITNEDTLSKWPGGPYALLTPNEGCPESDAHGWRRGYLSFTWKYQHVFESANECDTDTLHQNTWDGNTNHQHMRCKDDLTASSWPYHKSNLLGPFSRYAMRFNFCCKKINTTSLYNWPTGSYRIFGDASGCPGGFESSYETFMLPAINSWRFYGCIPDISVDKTQRYTELKMKLCNRKITASDKGESNLKILDTHFPFILLKVENETCPKLDDIIVEYETLQVIAKGVGTEETFDMFGICYFRHKTIFKDFDSYTYIQETLPSDLDVYAVSKPSITVVRKSLARSADSTSPLSNGYIGGKTSTPWLLLDLGQNLMVSGLQIINYPLDKIPILSYTGTLNRTVKGLPCQLWNHMTPHSHGYLKYEELYPDKSVSDAENYCRGLDYEECIWCFTLDPSTRWDCCAIKVFRRKPFSKCFIGEDRGQIDTFGSISCTYKLYHGDGALFYIFLRALEGRYISLAGLDDEDVSEFQSSTTVKVLTKPKLLHNQVLCNTQHGMADGFLVDEQISASSWQLMYPPSSARPFSSGWCADVSDKDPYIMVDMLYSAIFEGITVLNWYETVESITDGIYTKDIILKGVSTIQLNYFSNIEEQNEGQPMILQLDKFLPVDTPQTFYHKALVARYIQIRVVKSVSPDTNCLRFELIGCKNKKNLYLPELSKLHTQRGLTDNVKYGNINLQHVQSVITSIGYPTQYRSGISYTWTIKPNDNRFIELLFSQVSFSEFEMFSGPTIIGSCNQDSIVLKNAYTYEKGLTIDQGFNNVIFVIQSDVRYLSLTFKTCVPTSRIVSRGTGFEAFVKFSDAPTCFSLKNDLPKEILNSCSLPAMFLASLSQLNFPFSTASERWRIDVRRFSVHLELIDFNVRCDSGSVFSVTDRFSGTKTYCNLNFVPKHIYSESETLDIDFDKGAITDSALRISAKERFIVTYSTNTEDLSHMLDSFGTNFQVMYQLYRNDKYGYDGLSWQNATLLAYKGCSKMFGKCYSIFYRLGSPWKAAGEECWIRKHRLVSVHYSEEQQLLKYMLRNFRYTDLSPYNIENAFPKKTGQSDSFFYAHIGLTRVRERVGGNFHVWEDGSPVTFTAWNTGEPSIIGDCTRMSFHQAHRNNTWETASCEDDLANYFICEEPISEKLLTLSDSFKPHLYNGTLNYTENGIPCQRWDSSYPHTHGYILYEYIFPSGDMMLEENYCRDPEVNGYIWCYTMDPSERWQKCTQPPKVLETIFPHRYSGWLSKTSSGRTCQRWDSQYPHPHKAGDSNSSFPEDTVKDAENYCRDPTMEGTLFCYTTDPNREWEPCNYKDTESDRCFITLTPYTGQWNQTRSGKHCKNWHTVNLNKQLKNNFKFPDGSVNQAVNYCRDPYKEGFLWCFTSEIAAQSEPCFIDYKYTAAGSSSINTTVEGSFECANGDTISVQYLCDGIQDCVDFSDETSCLGSVKTLLRNTSSSNHVTIHNTNGSLHLCNNGEWMSMLTRCDDVIDCPDAIDEINCSKVLDTYTRSECSKDEFACGDSMCIHVSQMCDFIIDCVDASDEDCDYPQCSDSEFRCTNGQCIPLEKRCDSYEHCIDGTDENSCDICKEGTFHCDLVRCIPSRLVCDTYADCKDGDDEKSCGQPRHSSCENWWNAGYRNTGIYRLYDIDAVCDFDSVLEEENIFTIFHSFEVTYLGDSLEQIHSTEGELFLANQSSVGMIDILTDPSYTCTQNITQTCIHAVEALAQLNETFNISISCDCVTLTVYPYRAQRTLRYCNDERVLSDTDVEKHMLFIYSETKNKQRILSYKEGSFPRDAELRLSPIVCKNKKTITESTVGCGDENNVFPLSIRCVYEIDAAGFMIGCRSGNHLQGCEDFECPVTTVKCPRSFCLPVRFICDGVIHCPDADDEKDCGCKKSEREVIILSERTLNDNRVHQVKTLARQFHSHGSIIRHLQYKSRTNDAKLGFPHRFLDISDEVVKSHETVMRQFVCNYSILASDFVNSIHFTKNGSKGVIFVQDSKESEIIANMMFGRIKSKPDFHLFRVFRGTSGIPRKHLFNFVNDVAIKRWNILSSIGTTFFPQICEASSNVLCPGQYKCAASKQCILLEQVCDGHKHCIQGDDERLCQYTCPAKCTCSEFKTNCSGMSLDVADVVTIDINSRLLDLNRNPNLHDVFLHSSFDFPYLVHMYMSSCNIHTMKSYGFQSLPNLRVLDLSHNKISALPGFGFLGLQKLTSLNLIGNEEIYRIEPFALQGLQSLKIFELVGANIQLISSNAFSGLSLNVLNLTANKIKEIGDNIFNDLYAEKIYLTHTIVENFNEGLFRGVIGLTTLMTPSYKYCCIRPNYLIEDNCFPKVDEFSSCEDLLRLSALQTMLWLIGVCALIGNLLSVMYRLVYHRNKLKLNYEIFVTNLAVADAIMGIYLLIIAIADATFRKRYIFMDDYWRNSVWCTFAGFLATVSSEASVFFLCLITLDRFLVIKYPFGQFRLNSKHVLLMSTISWAISIIIALIPIIFDNFFYGQFYSKSGVCIALPLTRDRPPGWSYSVLIFLGLNFFTFCLIAWGQGSIYLEIRKVSSEIKSVTSKTMKFSQKRDMTVARNLLLVVASDFLCWFPIGCVGFMAMSGYEISSDVYAWIIVFVLPLNSALNPVLYTLSVSKSSRRRTTTQPSTAKSTLKTKSTKQTGALPDLFRYFLVKDRQDQGFISLNEVMCKKKKLHTVSVLKISLKLAHCLHLLHRADLSLDLLDKEGLFVGMRQNKITGDIQIRRKPTKCKRNNWDDIEKLGNIILGLLVLVSESKQPQI